jgi:hypothetical protein
MIAPNEEEVAGYWRRLHNEEPHNLYTSPNIIRVIESWRMRWAGQVARMGGMRNAYKILVGKPERKRPLGRPRRTWEDNIKIYIGERGWEDVDRIQDRDQQRVLVNTVINFWFQ